jgi:hypothetical protein
LTRGVIGAGTEVAGVYGVLIAGDLGADAVGGGVEA